MKKIKSHRVAELRFELGLSQKELGQALAEFLPKPLTQRAVANWEQNVNGISPRSQKALVDYFGRELGASREEIFTYE